MRKIYIIGATALLFAACKPSVNVTKTPTAGSVNFTNYLAVGNSLTAGYMDNSLTVFGQLNSYPQRLFEQFSLVPSPKGARGPFILPLLHSNNGYPGAKKILSLVTNCLGDTSLGPIDYPGFQVDPIDAQPYNSGVNNDQINDIGVPGIRIADYLVPYYYTANPYAARFYHNVTGPSTPMDELSYRVTSYHPTFFTLWLGSNDVLGYATAGGQGDGTGNAQPLGGSNVYNTNDITPLAVFQKIYDSVVTVITQTSASGALINIPDVTSIPFFNTIPANGLTITRQSLADSLQQLYSVDKAVFQVGSNFFMIKDNAGKTRQAVPGELILLTVPTDSITCYGYGTLIPIPNQYVLTTDEIQDIRTMTNNYNAFIQQEALLHNLAYVDMNTFLKGVATGVSYNGVKYSAQFVTGGAFSLDGVHPTARGYALIANQIISTINQQYGSTIPPVDVNKYEGVNFP